MTETQRLILKIASGILDYPGSSAFGDRLQRRKGLAGEVDPRLLAVIQSLFGPGPLQLEQLYVETFDFNPRHALYVTAQEMGDARERGQALLEWAALYGAAGYEVPDGQLADYVPMLLELTAVRPDVVQQAFIDRLAAACAQIADTLEVENPYRPLFDLIVDTLGGQGGQESNEPRPAHDAAGGLDDLPYPLHYPGTESEHGRGVS